MQLHRAERRRAKLRAWISGQSSSGKTFSALTLFKGFGGKTALIDTEAGRGELYGGTFDYDVLTLEKPYTPERYIEAIKTVQEAGYDNLIIDSISHEWMELLEIKGKLDEKGGNQWTNWNLPTRRHNALMEHINQSKLHVISTSRVKRKHVQEQDEKGKTKIRLVGLDDVQRDGSEYDQVIEFRIDVDHTATAVKDNTGLFLGKDPKVLTEEDGKAIKAWLDSGKEVIPDCTNCAKKGLATPADSHLDGMDLCSPCRVKYLDIKSKQDLDRELSK